MTDKISLRQYICMIIMFGYGSFIVTHGTRHAKQDTWIIILLGFLIVLPQIFIIAYINTKNEGEHIFSVFKKYYGKIIGTIFSLYFIISLLIMATFVLRMFGEYMQTTALRQTPFFIILLLIISSAYYITTHELKTITKLSAFLFICFISVFLCVSIFSFTIIKNIENMMPIFHLTNNETIKYSLESYMNPFYEVFVFLILGFNLKKGKSQYTSLAIGYFIITLTLSFNSLRNILILGTPAYQNLYFPSYISNTVLSSGSMMERVELLLSFFFAFSIYIKLILLLKAPSIGIKNIFKNSNEKWNLVYICILLFFIATFYFKNLEHFFQVFYGSTRFYINIGILGIILLTFIFTIFKSKNPLQVNKSIKNEPTDDAILNAITN